MQREAAMAHFALYGELMQPAGKAHTSTTPPAKSLPPVDEASGLRVNAGAAPLGPLLKIGMAF